MGDQLPTGQLSVVPWRRTGVKYTNNEAYFDVIEEIDAIIDKSGRSFSCASLAEVRVLRPRPCVAVLGWGLDLHAVVQARVCDRWFF